jgi:hypothetical protein
VRKLGPWDLRLRKQPKYSTLKRFKCPDQNKMEMQAPLFSFQFWHIYTHSKMDQRPDTSQLLISFQVNASVSWMLRWLIDRLIIRGWVYTQPGPCLVPRFHSQILLCKKKIPVTSKWWHMHGVLNVDEIKN